uniref:Uncharacterized protein n=1 Tax=Arundo donax TaxID=35708 RepID=A0A0A9BH52_ARUDO
MICVHVTSYLEHGKTRKSL